MDQSQILNRPAMLFHIDGEVATLYEQKPDAAPLGIAGLNLNSLVKTRLAFEKLKNQPIVKALMSRVSICIIRTDNPSALLNDGNDCVTINLNNSSKLLDEDIHFNIACVFNKFFLCANNELYLMKY